MRLSAILVGSFLASFCSAQGGIGDATKGLKERKGLISSYVDSKEAKALFRFAAPKPGTDLLAEVLYNESLTTGLGNNDVDGLDRGAPGATYLLRFRLIGNKVLLEVPNYDYRATSTNPAEQEATRSAFATSVVWAAPVAARDANGDVLVNMTDFLVRDAHDSGKKIGYTLDPLRSAFLPERSRSFPDNLEFDALLTFKSDSPTQTVGNHAPESKYVTFTQHHSFVRLPDSNYQPRKFHPRSGLFGMSYMDFSAPLGQPLLKQFIVRHRLEKTEAGSPRSRVKKPIVYYVDPGVPEPIKQALIDGGNYWKKAFEAAGFIDGFRVEAMPAGMDPMDVRYNVIHWTNRSTRGWAFGSSVIDPRTGEIVRGVVNLDSQRIRQDIRLFEGLVGTTATGSGKPNDPIKVALSRVRQLSAHEIGHTLGLQHNFAASGKDRQSVMDYPAPRITANKDGSLNFSDTYAQGVGRWDMQVIRYGYSQWPPGANEAKELGKVIDDNWNYGLQFLPDADASERTGAHPYSNRWDDNGVDALGGLADAMRIRRIAMAKFGEPNLQRGQPISDLELVFGPVYFFHRYTIDAAAKLVGGLYYAHSLNGDDQSVERPVSGKLQWQAVDALLKCLEPSELEVPARISRMLGRRTNGQPSSKESFASTTPFAFDSIGAASAAADLVFVRLLDPDKCARIVELSARYPEHPKLEELLSRVSKAVVLRPTGTAMQKEIRWALHTGLISRLIQMAELGSPTVKPRALVALKSVHATELTLAKTDRSGYATFLATEINRYLTRQTINPKLLPLPAPALPGAPIG